jgi:hypothetical protein
MSGFEEIYERFGLVRPTDEYLRDQRIRRVARAIMRRSSSRSRRIHHGPHRFDVWASFRRGGSG